MSELCREGLKTSSFRLVHWVLPSLGLPPRLLTAAVLSGRRRAMVVPRSESCSAPTRLAGLAKTNNSWMSQGLEGENGVRRMRDFCGVWRTHTGVKCQAVLLLHSCFRLPWGISLHSQQGRGQRGQALLGISAGRIADSWRRCQLVPGKLTVWEGLLPDPAWFCSAAPAPAPSLFRETEHWRGENVLRRQRREMSLESQQDVR